MKNNDKSPILKKWTRYEIANKLGVSYQTVVNWFDGKHPSSMSVKHLEPLGFCIVDSSVLEKTTIDLINNYGAGK